MNKLLNNFLQYVAIDTESVPDVEQFPSSAKQFDLLTLLRDQLLELGIKAEMDEHGSKMIYEGDVLHIRLSTTDVERTKDELFAIIGEQVCEEQEVADV